MRLEVTFDEGTDPLTKEKIARLLADYASWMVSRYLPYGVRAALVHDDALEQAMRNAELYGTGIIVRVGEDTYEAPPVQGLTITVKP